MAEDGPPGPSYLMGAWEVHPPFVIELPPLGLSTRGHHRSAQPATAQKQW